jgi:hypothetical protein
VLEPGEALRYRTPTTEAILAVTDRRLIVADPTRIALAVPFRALRRVQFDIERRRPATLVIVPDHPADEPQVLSIPSSQYDAAAGALAAIGHEFARLEPDLDASET